MDAGDGNVIPPFFDLGGGLIDHGAAIDDVDEPAGNAVRVPGKGAEPYRDNGGFTETGGDVGGSGDFAADEPFVERRLPWEGGRTGEGLEGMRKIERWHGGLVGYGASGRGLSVSEGSRLAFGEGFEVARCGYTRAAFSFEFAAGVAGDRPPARAAFCSQGSLVRLSSSRAPWSRLRRAS